MDIKKLIKILLTGVGVLSFAFVSGLIVFFKTDLFENERALWVETAMSTSNHQYLATWFLSQEEIDSILSEHEVINDTNSNSESVQISEPVENKITEYDISGDTYTGTVVTISDPTSVSLMNTLEDGSGQKLSEVVSNENLAVAMNAGGFSFSRRLSSSGGLNSLTIIDGTVLYGESGVTYSMIGMSKDGKLMLGNYTIEQALEAGIDDAIEFGPFLVVNGENQIDSEVSGGIQPRTAIGQTEDGTFIFVVIEGRTTQSLGATYYDLQEIMNDFGAVNAANLDGGGSSSLYYYGTLMNTLSNNSERSIPTAFVVTGA
ncbi:hypothetical protein AOC36_07235 [Erysipelothrix larvae]|uniref:Phosphodiester glycosidase domain-containing protein n=1 Tax=Erysipelothrix larvae TaxID=1514105 RepID=A0A120JTS1_9FIRM|nr:phosphodiester glycosidase family protein [Erysipelothrix larvae]AMC93782.1 hypothetical protein AOC36_07235 [Erysipelothrix larvae]